MGIWVNIVRSWDGFNVCCCSGYHSAPETSGASGNALCLGNGLNLPVCTLLGLRSRWLVFGLRFMWLPRKNLFFCHSPRYSSLLLLLRVF